MDADHQFTNDFSYFMDRRQGIFLIDVLNVYSNSSTNTQLTERIVMYGIKLMERDPHSMQFSKTEVIVGKC